MQYDIDQLYQSGKLNDYFKNKLRNSWLFMNSDSDLDYSDFMKDVLKMSELGVSSKEDELAFRRIQHDVPDVIQDIISKEIQLGDYWIDALMEEMYINRNDYDMSDLVYVFCSVAKAAQKLGIPLSDEANESCYMQKAAYPQGLQGDNMKAQYDISKWIHATKDIYSRMYRLGLPYNAAFSSVTDNWDKMEKLDYKHWLKFYTEGVPSKYPKLASAGLRKQAQGYVSDNGFYLPTANLLPHQNQDIPKPKPQEDQNDVRDKIEYQRSKILSRLSSAEKLLCSLDGQHFAGDEQDFMLKLLQDLKRKVQTANKISIKSSLFYDLIKRAGNYMFDVRGSHKGKAFFYKTAQIIDPFAGATPPMGMDPASSGTAPASETTGDIAQDTRLAIREMLEMAEKGVYDHDDDPDERKAIKQEKEQAEQAAAQAQASTVPPSGQQASPAPAQAPAQAPKQASAKQASFDDIIVTAQAVDGAEEMNIGEAEAAPPGDKPRQQRQKLDPQKGELTVSEDDIKVEDNTDDVIEAALDNIGIKDAISRLEILVGIYKQREVPRQLAILDIMMDQLGLSSFFPQLGEAQSKALESTQYISTRLEDVLSKLQGSVQSAEGEKWVEQEKTVSPETQAVQNTLQSEKDKEEKRKQMRKQKSDEKLEQSKTNVGEQAAQELGGPAAVETGTPVQVR